MRRGTVIAGGCTTGRGTPLTAQLDALQRYHDEYAGSHAVLRDMGAIRKAAMRAPSTDTQDAVGLTFVKFTHGAKTEYGVWEVDAAGQFRNAVINEPQYNLAGAFARNAKTHTAFPMSQSRQRRVVQESVFDPNRTELQGSATQVVMSGLQKVVTNTPSVELTWFYDPQADKVVYVRSDSLARGY